MVQFHRVLAPVVLVKDRSVAVKSPPLTELTIPATGQCIEELRIVERCDGVKVLITEMSSEAILARQVADENFVEQ